MIQRRNIYISLWELFIHKYSKSSLLYSLTKFIFLIATHCFPILFENEDNKDYGKRVERNSLKVCRKPETRVDTRPLELLTNRAQHKWRVARALKPAPEDNLINID